MGTDHSRQPEGARWQFPDKVLDELALEPGASVADLGSGDGYFTLYLAERVGPSGTVYAVDIDADALAELERRAAARGLDNVVTVEAKADDPLLPDAAVDLVFVCNVYHHIDSRVGYFAQLQRDLAPGGRVAIVEGRTTGASTWVSPPGHGTALSALQGEMSKAGYRLLADFDFLPFQHFAIFAPDAG